MSFGIRPLLPSDIAACDAINRSLPAWFGLETGLAEALEYLHTHRGLVACQEEEVIGFLTWQQEFPESAEIRWMAVNADHHRRGVGRTLVEALEHDLIGLGCQMLSVKTLASAHPSPEYARTRAFYTSMGFLRQMVLPDLWDPSNPCLVMVKVLSSHTSPAAWSGGMDRA